VVRIAESYVTEPSQPSCEDVILDGVDVIEKVGDESELDMVDAVEVDDRSELNVFDVVEEFNESELDVVGVVEKVDESKLSVVDVVEVPVSTRKPK